MSVATACLIIHEIREIWHQMEQEIINSTIKTMQFQLDSPSRNTMHLHDTSLYIFVDTCHELRFQFIGT
jgi:hypothetical protein